MSWASWAAVVEGSLALVRSVNLSVQEVEGLAELLWAVINAVWAGAGQGLLGIENVGGSMVFQIAPQSDGNVQMVVVVASMSNLIECHSVGDLSWVNFLECE